MLKKMIPFILPLLSISAQANIDFLCPTSQDDVVKQTTDYDAAKDLMYSPMMKDYVWGKNGSDATPIIFQDDEGTFKIGYDYNAKECTRQIILEDEVQPGLWKGKTIVHICAPNVAKLFENTTSFDQVWPKLQALAGEMDKLAEQKKAENKQCFEDHKTKSKEADKITEKFANFKDDVNEDGKINQDDYEDTNRDEIVNDGDRGVVNGESYQMVYDEYLKASQVAEDHFQYCLDSMSIHYQVTSKANSIRNLEMQSHFQGVVEYLKDGSGNLLPKFSVPLISFKYQRKMANVQVPDPDTGLFAFYDKEGRNAVYQQLKGCEMHIEHQTSYGGLAQSYDWDFNYEHPYAAHSWSFDQNGVSKKDDIGHKSNLEALNFLDIESDFTPVAPVKLRY